MCQVCGEREPERQTEACWKCVAEDKAERDEYDAEERYREDKKRRRTIGEPSEIVPNGVRKLLYEDGEGYYGSAYVEIPNDLGDYAGPWRLFLDSPAYEYYDPRKEWIVLSSGTEARRAAVMAVGEGGGYACSVAIPAPYEVPTHRSAEAWWMDDDTGFLSMSELEA